MRLSNTREQLEESKPCGNNKLTSMSHPKTMLNVLRHCLKLLRQQQSKEVLLKEVLRVRHWRHTPLPPAVQGDCYGCLPHTQRLQGCLWCAVPPLKYCPAIPQIVSSTSYTTRNTQHKLAAFQLRNIFFKMLCRKIKACFQDFKKSNRHAEYIMSIQHSQYNINVSFFSCRMETN